ncbi:MAG: DUF3592 domain-containing protein [Burkholderiales bacterium]|nr:DUF3592 domain-containing protein [Burkholderiales bacterium]
MIEMIMKIPENYLIPAEWPVMLFFGVPGFVLFVVGCVMGLRRYALYRGGVPVLGHVVETERQESRSKDREGRWTTSVARYPVVEFAAAGGTKHRFTAAIPNGLFNYSKLGSTVNVLYDPKDPSTARIAHFAEFWAEPLYYGLPGFLVFGFSIGLFFLYQQRMISDHAYYAEVRRESEDRARLHEENEIRRIKTAVMRGEILLLKGVVESVRQQQRASREEYVVLCRATLADGISQERFEAAPISFHPGPGILGKSAEIYVDPGDKTRYQVRLEPVLAELQSANRASGGADRR